MTALEERVLSLKWLHQIDFGGGLISPGLAAIAQLEAQAEIYFAGGVEGKTVLDVGCWDGFNSIDALRRRARRVLATDHWVWTHHNWASRATIELAKEHIFPELEIQDIDVPDLSIETVGRFDIVLFCGVFYHLRHPFLLLESVAKLANETLIVETHMDALNVDQPAMIFYPGSELNGDGSNWWGPNQACLEAMLRDVGFRSVIFTQHPTIPSRGIFRGSR